MIHINKTESLYGFGEHVYLRAVNNFYLKWKKKLGVIHVHKAMSYCIGIGNIIWPTHKKITL